MDGYIKLDRQMLEWGWYDDPITKVVFLHLLLTANWKEGEYHGYPIKAGDAVFGMFALANHLGLTVQQVRTALKHLQKTGEISIKSTNKFSVATLVNWAKYQSDCPDLTNKQQTNNKPSTTPKERKKERIVIPPARDDVRAYIAEKGLNVDVERFFDYYDSNGWKVGNTKMKDWKATLRNWNRRNENSAPTQPMQRITW